MATTEGASRRMPSFGWHLKFTPLAAMMLFITASILLFFFGPFVWSITNNGTLAIFLLSSGVAITVGYSIGVSAAPRRGFLKHWRYLYFLGAISSCIMIFPSAYVYTGKMPWDAFGALLDQGKAYKDFQDRILELDNSRWPVVLGRSLTQWLIYAVVPLAIFRWNSLSLGMRMLLLATILAAVSFSLLRGTDQGTIDLAFIFAASFGVVVARWCAQSGRSLWSLLKSRNGVLVILIFAVIAVAAINVFIERKSQRYQGQISNLCIGEHRQICVNSNHPLVAGMGDRWRFGLGIVTSYMSQGYYGLALSLEREFASTFGIGHSSAITRLYETISQDEKLYQRSFTYRLRESGWSDLYQWSSIYTWIANDVGFPATILVVGFLAWLWGCAWRDAVFSDNDAAGIVFCMLSQTFVYSPANFQIALAADTYFALLVWLGVWKCTSGPPVRRRNRFVGRRL